MAADIQEVLSDVLTEKLFESVMAFQNLDHPSLDDVIKFGHTIATYEYLQYEHDLDAGERDALLEFENPLEVATAAKECLDKRGKPLSIRDALAEINARSVFPLAPPAQMGAPEKLAALMNRLDENNAAFRKKLEGMTVSDVVDSIDTIAGTINTYLYMKEEYVPDADEVDHLLKFQNPLEVVASHWSNRPHELIDLDFVMEGVMSEQERDSKIYPLFETQTGTGPLEVVDETPPTVEFPMALESGFVYVFQLKDGKEQQHLRLMDYSYYEKRGLECDAKNYDMVHKEPLGSVREVNEYFEKVILDWEGLPHAGLPGRPIETGDIVVITPSGQAHALFNEGGFFYEPVDYFLGQVASNVDLTNSAGPHLIDNNSPEKRVTVKIRKKQSITEWLKEQVNKPGQPIPNSIPKHIRDDESR